METEYNSYEVSDADSAADGIWIWLWLRFWLIRWGLFYLYLYLYLYLINIFIKMRPFHLRQRVKGLLLRLYFYLIWFDLISFIWCICTYLILIKILMKMKLFSFAAKGQRVATKIGADSSAVDHSHTLAEI